MPLRLRAIFPPAIVALLTVAVFSPAVFNNFVDWDDSIMLQDNPLMRSVSWHALGQIWAHPQLGLYTPLSYTLWLFLAGISRATTGQLDPRLFHTLNVALHTGCAVLVYVLLHQLFYRRWPSFIGAMLFALHPLQVEPAAWVAGMNNLLAAIWSLAAINLYVRAIRLRSHPAYIAAMACAVLAMLFKPTAIVLPILVVVIDRIFFKTAWREILYRSAPFIAIAFVFILIGSSAQPSPGIDRPALWQRPFIAGDALAFYMAKLVAPLHLNMDYGRSPAWLIAQPSLYINWLLPAAVLIIAVAFRKVAWLFAGVAIFVLAPLPVLGLRPFDFQHFSTVADRYVYLAMLGPAIIATGATNLRPRLAIAMLILLLLMVIPTELQIRVWQSDETLFRRALLLNPRSVAANRTMGYFAAKRGDPMTARMYYDAALAVRPDDRLTRHNYANLNNISGIELEKSGNLQGAAADYRLAIEMDRSAAEPHCNLARVLESQGDLSAARREYEESLRLDPQLAPAQRGLARLNAASTSPVH